MNVADTTGSGLGAPGDNTVKDIKIMQRVKRNKEQRSSYNFHHLPNVSQKKKNFE